MPAIEGNRGEFIYAIFLRQFIPMSEIIRDIGSNLHAL